MHSVSLPSVALMEALSLCYSCTLNSMNDSAERCENKHICPAVACCFTVDTSNNQTQKSSEDRVQDDSVEFIFLRQQSFRDLNYILIAYKRRHNQFIITNTEEYQQKLNAFRYFMEFKKQLVVRLCDGDSCNN